MPISQLLGFIGKNKNTKKAFYQGLTDDRKPYKLLYGD